MSFQNKKVFISGAYRDFGRTLAKHFANEGAELFLTVRGHSAHNKTLDFFTSNYKQPVHVYDCDLTDHKQLALTMSTILNDTHHIDIIINNAAMWLQGSLDSASDEEIINTINSGATGSLLIIKYLEKHLLKSKSPDIVNMISAAGLSQGKANCGAHEAFFGMKHAQSGMAQLLTTRLKDKGVRVISLYPPDFDNIEENSELWDSPEQSHFGAHLTSRELIDTIHFALTRPRSCMMNQIIFESTKK